MRAGTKFIVFAYLVPFILVAVALWSLDEARDTNKELTAQVKRLSLQNCSTINENTKATYQVALAFKALADILNGVPGALPPGGKLKAVVEEPEYLPCRLPAG